MDDTENEEFKFEIKAYSPETIPMERLAQYMAVFARLLSNTANVHFKELRSGSTELVARAEHEAIPKVAKRLNSVKVAEAPKDAMDAVNTANSMLRDDNATGRILHGNTAQIIYFPGKEIPKPEKIGPFSEPATFKGELVRLEGEDDTKHAGIKDAQGRLWAGEMSREIAVQMRELVFEWVLVEGVARWVRNEDGTWEVKHFKINSCKALPKDTLEDDINSLRNIAGNKWKEMSDPVGFIRESRNDDDEIH